MKELNVPDTIHTMIRELKKGDEVQVFFGNIRISGKVIRVTESTLTVKEDMITCNQTPQVINIDITKIIAFSKK